VRTLAGIPALGRSSRPSYEAQMAYFLNLFTPETWSAFREHGADISGFRKRQQRIARERLKPGDVFLCYLTRLSRWCGVLQIESQAFYDETPIFGDPDPFCVRFKVKPVVVLAPEQAVPIFEDRVWSGLSITRGLGKGAVEWTGYVRGSLRELNQADGDFLVALLKRQDQEQSPFPLTDRDKRRLAGKLTVRALDREVAVEVPGADEDEAIEPAAPDAPSVQETRHSLQVQAQVARLGAEMGFRVWIPRSDRVRVLELIPPHMHKSFLDRLPLNYDDTTLQTIEQIDVIWLKGRSMARAFEIEHTTAVYSGLLRMADLLALQPNMDIHLHIVAPDEKRDKVLKEIKRPVFSLLDQGPLYEKCTFLSYGAVRSLGEMKHLSHMSDTILEEYEETAEE
jgi:hypothetical protein